MTKKLGRWPVFLAMALFSALGFGLRRWQLAVSLDQLGLPTGQGVWPVVILCALAVAVFLLIARGYEKEAEYEQCVSAGLPQTVLAVAGAGMILAGHLSVFTTGVPMSALSLSQRLTAILGCVTALCFVAVTASWYRQKRPSGVTAILPMLYYILQLIFNFKRWSTDPIILDYCFTLFSQISVMLAVFHFGAFSFGKGNRRAGVFFGLTGVFFSAVSLADGTNLLVTAGFILWLLANLWQLLVKDE